MDILKVDSLCVRYGSFEAVKNVSFSLPKGEILGIVGESGSGKSTIAKVIMNLHRDYTGSVEVFSPLKPQMVFQDAVGSLNPRKKIGSVLLEVLKFNGVANLREEVSRLLELVALPSSILNQYPREMSGGQCQRVSIARALAARTELLVADEPVSALDVSVQARILNLLRDLNRSTGLSVILIAHDLAVVKNICDSVIVLNRGEIVDSGSSDDVFASPTSEYTRRLLAAVPGRNL